jgi:GntR family transcriptional regulator, rspAB operon transcriptional repressor
MIIAEKVKRSGSTDGRLAQQAYDLIRERILRGQLPFGVSISRRQLSEELGMSTLPISEALQRLQNEALVETVPRVGTLVRIPTPQDVRGFYVVREALESQAARLFAEKATPADRQELLQSAVELDVAYKRCAGTSGASEQQLFDLRDQHMRFHLRLAECARCPFLYEAIEKNQILIFNWFFDRLFGYPGLPDNWHSELAQVLAQNDPEAADRAMRRHVRCRMDELLVRLEPYFSLNGQRLASDVNGHAKRPAAKSGKAGR